MSLDQFAGRINSNQLVRGPSSFPVRLVVKETLEGFLVLLQKDGAPLLNEGQIKELTGLTYLNGIPFLSLNDKEFLFEFMGLLHGIGYYESIKFLTDINIRQTLRQDILWKFPTLKKVKEQLEIEAEILKNKEQGVADVGKCSKCGNKDRLVFALKNCRASDEAAVTFIRCLECGNRWTE